MWSLGGAYLCFAIGMRLLRDVGYFEKDNWTHPCPDSYTRVQEICLLNVPLLRFAPCPPDYVLMEEKLCSCILPHWQWALPVKLKDADFRYDLGVILLLIASASSFVLLFNLIWIYEEGVTPEKENAGGGGGKGVPDLP